MLWCSGLSDGDPDYFSHAWREYAVGEPCATWAETFHPADRDAFFATLARLLRTGESCEIELRIRRGDGALRWHRLKLAIAEGEPRRWFAHAEEVRDPPIVRIGNSRSPASNRLAAQIDERLLAWVSHELRAPIASILLWEQVLRDESNPELRSRALDAIRQSTATQERLVADLLDVARATSGKLRVDLRPIEIATTIQHALAAIEPAAAQKGLRVVQEIGPELGYVLGDVSRLRQVLDNLLSNSIKFTGAGGTITLRARRTPTSIVVDVVDTGRGITPEFLSHVFEPFRQADDTLTRNEPGLGLGLAIADDLVRMHDGTLAVWSDGAGKGTTFTMTLPVPGILPAIEPPPPIDKADITGMHVLVVDDDPRVCDALQVLLERAGAVVHTAASAAAALDALQLLQGVSLDILLSDIAMPGEDGYSLMRRIRFAKSSIPAVAISAHANAGTRALAAGFDLFVTKPLDVDGLIRSMAKLVETRRTT